MTAEVARLDGVSVDFRTGGEVVPALHNVSVSFVAGSSTAVIGRSGSGKSTLISVLALLRRPTRGEVTVRGERVAGLGDAELSALRARVIGTVFQSFHLDPAFTAEQNAMLPWYFTGGASRRAARARARELLDLLGIGELAGRLPGQMSGGQRQRVAIARALFSDPAVLVADEPTGNLDEATAEATADVIFGLAAQTPTAVVVVTHDRQVAERAEHLLHLVRGGLVASPDARAETA